MREQIRITVPGGLRAEIDAIRERFNPELVRNNPAHATIVYHDELADPALLRERLAAAVAETEPFELEVGGARRFRQATGAYLAVTDPTGAVERLRRAILAPPSTPRTRLMLHVTLLHPAFGHRLEEAWPAFAPLRFDRRFRVDVLDLMSGSREGLSTSSHPFRAG
ncbi:MAG TPA: 2'-5' RNA ligase family protein [Myxococcota bacterium]|nr:2'-5' RNA ligase family protein [Myxococcota bacterium]